MAMIQNEDIEQGETFRRKAIVTKEDDGAVFNLTGWTPRGQVRTISGNTLVSALTCTVSNPSAGEVMYELPAAVTATMRDTHGYFYRYDVELSQDGTTPEVVIKPVKGKIRVFIESTKE